jgi:hypothetical protein
MTDGFAATLDRARHGEPRTYAEVGVLVDGAAGLDGGGQLRQALERVGLTDVQLWAHRQTGLLARLEHNRIVLVLLSTDEFAREVLDAIEHEPPPALWAHSPLKGSEWKSQKTVLISTDAAAQGASESSRHRICLPPTGIWTGSRTTCSATS